MKNYEEVMRWIDHQYTNMIEQTEEAVNINSGSDNLIGLDSMLHFLIQISKNLECNREIISLPSKKQLKLDGTIVDIASGKALLLTKRPKAPIQVLLGGHMDTVYPETSPFQKATRINSEILQGPGAADMKGGLIILLNTIKAFEFYKHKHQIGWQILITPDEETGSMASEPLHKLCAQKHDFGMIFEPTFLDGIYTSARKGSINFSIISKGKASHAGRDFHLGKNAINPLVRVLEKLNQLNTKNSETTLNIAKIEGGQAANIVPDLAIATCNVRTGTATEALKIKEQIKDIIATENEHLNTSLVYFQWSERPPKPFTEIQKSLFELFKMGANDLNAPFEWKKSGGVCDGNNWYSYGLPTIDTLGVVGSDMHTSNERMQLISLVDQTKLCTSILMRLSSGELNTPLVNHWREKNESKF